MYRILDAELSNAEREPSSFAMQ